MQCSVSQLQCFVLHDGVGIAVRATVPPPLRTIDVRDTYSSKVPQGIDIFKVSTFPQTFVSFSPLLDLKQIEMHCWNVDWCLRVWYVDFDMEIHTNRVYDM